MNPQLIAVIIQQLPTVIGGIRELFHKSSPNAPQLTDAEIIAAFEQAYQASLARDEQWLADHPI